MYQMREGVSNERKILGQQDRRKEGEEEGEIQTQQELVASKAEGAKRVAALKELCFGVDALFCLQSFLLISQIVG